MIKIHVSYPPEITVPLLSAQRLHHRICKTADASMTNETLRRMLLDWAESLTDVNCEWFEYDVAQEVAAQLQARGIPIKPADPPSMSSIAPPGEAVELIKSFPRHDVSSRILCTAVVMMTDKTTAEKLSNWANTKNHGCSWAERWVAKQLRPFLDLGDPPTC